MLISKVKKLPPWDIFMYWIHERESIRLGRTSGRRYPWTDDEILQTYRFCNVRRIDDTVSSWLVNNWYRPNCDHKNMVPAIVLARHINKIDSLKAVGFPKTWKSETIKERLYEYKSRGGPVFSGAYMVRGNDAVDKISSVLDFTCQPFYDKPINVKSFTKMEEAWATIKEYHGMGSFMAGQVVADLRWATTRPWTDRNIWAPKGPGSMRGMNRLHLRELKTQIPQKDFEYELMGVMENGKKELSESITKSMEAMDWQNCLCESDKYLRTLYGDGTPKQLFRNRS